MGFWTITPFFGWGRYVPEGNMCACGTDYFSLDIMNQTYLYAYTFWCYILPFFIICYCYWFIVKCVSAHEKQMKEQAARMGVKSLRGDKEAQNKSNDCKLAKIALITVSLWFMAWTPYAISHPKYKVALYQKMPWLQCAGETDDGDDSKSNASTGTNAEEKA